MGVVHCQHDEYDYNQPKAYVRPQPAILMHKQALSHDGSFNYAFAADNGLKQGESISPDGTRSGAYSYVDPEGQTISVRYTAGKDGFKILEGDHVPKAPAPVAVHQPAPHQAYYSGTKHNHRVAPDDGQYHEENDRSVSPAYAPRDRPAYSAYKQSPVPAPRYRVQEEATYNNERQDEEEEEYKGPHTFGSGYAFQFGG